MECNLNQMELESDPTDTTCFVSWEYIYAQKTKKNSLKKKAKNTVHTLSKKKKSGICTLEFLCKGPLNTKTWAAWQQTLSKYKTSLFHVYVFLERKHQKSTIFGNIGRKPIVLELEKHQGQHVDRYVWNLMYINMIVLMLCEMSVV